MYATSEVVLEVAQEEALEVPLPDRISLLDLFQRDPETDKMPRVRQEDEAL